MRLTHYHIKFLSENGKYYLINTLNGSIKLINKDLYDDILRIEAGNIDSISKNSIIQLKKQSILISEEEEKLLIDNAYHIYKNRKNDHLAAFFYLSYDCNLSCTYCNYKDIKPSQRSMSDLTLEESFNSLDEILLNDESDKSEITIIIFGGEPFLKKNEKLIQIFFHRYAQLKQKYEGKKKINLLLFSNGIELPYFTAKYTDLLLTIDSLYITISGDEKTHDSTRVYPNGKGCYQSVLKGVESSITRGIKTWLVFNANEHNINQLDNINELISVNKWGTYKSFLGCCVSRIKSRGDKSAVTFTESELIKAVQNLVLNKDLNLQYFNFEDMRILKTVMKLIGQQDLPFEEKNYFQFNGCGNRIHQYSFTPERMIYPCSPSIGNKELAIGNLVTRHNIQTPLKSCWTYKNVTSKPNCKNCSMAFLCGGGCQYTHIKEGISSSECASIKDLLRVYINSLEYQIKIVNDETVYDKN